MPGTTTAVEALVMGITLLHVLVIVLYARVTAFMHRAHLQQQDSIFLFYVVKVLIFPQGPILFLVFSKRMLTLSAELVYLALEMKGSLVKMMEHAYVH
jgi:hypothetical protein